MSPRTGRPKKDDAMRVRYSIHLDQGTEMKLKHFCEEKNISKAEGIRQAIVFFLDKKNS